MARRAHTASVVSPRSRSAFMTDLPWRIHSTCLADGKATAVGRFAASHGDFVQPCRFSRSLLYTWAMALGLLELQCLGLWGTGAPHGLRSVNPTVELNGDAVKARWGLNQIKIAPGNYILVVYFDFAIQRYCNRAVIEIDIEPQRTLSVRYRIRLLSFMAGRIAVVDQTAMARVHKGFGR
jgi:hypothetical protein